MTLGHIHRTSLLTRLNPAGDTPASCVCMASENTSVSVLAPGPGRQCSPDPVSFFAHTATLECHAALQLLAERARFLTAATGVAIAIDEAGSFTYSAVIGDFAADAGSTVDLGRKYLSECVRLEKSIRIRSESSFALAVPIMRGVEVVGIFELLGSSAFEDRDVESITRLAGMVSTAWDHRDAAARAEKATFDEKAEKETTRAPSRRHAPEIDTSPPIAAPGASPVEDKPALASSPIAIQKCSSCGFPVSTGRKMCVDCDKNADGEIAPEPVELFTIPAEESWLSAHGYTIVSLLLSAITIAIVLWLRAR